MSGCTMSRIQAPGFAVEQQDAGEVDGRRVRVHAEEFAHLRAERGALRFELAQLQLNASTAG